MGVANLGARTRSAMRHWNSYRNSYYVTKNTVWCKTDAILSQLPPLVLRSLCRKLCLFLMKLFEMKEGIMARNWRMCRTAPSVMDLRHAGSLRREELRKNIWMLPVATFRGTTLLNHLNAELNPISHLLALLKPHHILHIRVKREV